MKVILQTGTRKEGTLVPIPKEMLSQETIPGAIYEIEVKTKGVSNPQQAIETLKKELTEKAKVEVKWIAIYEDGTIRIQFKGSPIAISLIVVIVFLALGAIAVIVTLIIVYQLVGAIIEWFKKWGIVIAIVGAILVGIMICLPYLRKKGS